MRPMIATVTSLLTLFLAGGAALTAEPGVPYTGPWPGWHGPWVGLWWICPLMMLFMFVFFAAICFAFRGRRGHWGPPWRWMGEYTEGRGEGAGDSPLDILNKRYARGEIDKREYAEIKAAITSDDRSPGEA